VPIATLQAAEFLIQQKDPARIRAWLSKHTAQERAGILQHLEQRKRARTK
jgi:macrodomain Ter protein organizer (MatP/YcbG family)